MAQHNSLRKMLPMYVDIVILVTLFVLDVRDLNFKINWLGPFDTYKFTATGFDTLEAAPILPAMNFTGSGQLIQRDSGWTSFLEKCDSITPMGTGFFFLHAFGNNCTIGNIGTNSTVISHLVLSSSLRPDSMAWASCKLLYINRKPAICQNTIVTNFVFRYNIEDIFVPTEWLALPGSEAERELLAMLDLIGDSSPLKTIVCVETFEYKGPGDYNSTIFGCGSPNIYRSAFVGYHATHFKDLHQDKAWLTVDVLNIMGFRYSIRQNDISLFTMTETNGVPTIAHTTLINFSTYGQLYSLAIITDVFLMVIHLLSAIQIAKNIILPALKSKVGQAVLANNDFTSFFTRSLYRSTPIVLLTLLTQLLSWMIILPNCVVWTWSEYLNGRAQAYMSSLRVWVLILLSLNFVWDLFVFFNEKLAFRVVTRTYMSAIEIIVVGAIVSYVKRDLLFAIGGDKYVVEAQRQSDFTSFTPPRLAYGNSWSDESDMRLNTSTEVMGIIFSPLFLILLLSLLALVAYLILKFLIFHFQVLDYLCSKRRRTSACAVKSETAPKSDDAAQGPTEEQLVMKSSVAAALQAGQDEYKRLPLEELLNIPIRAKSLVRDSFEMTHLVNGKRYVRSPYYLDFGIYFTDRNMRARAGFLQPVPPNLVVDSSIMPCDINEKKK
ncbi:TPA: hypothetical protein N0F65_001053 [Lagenidium giganteum]|uniref:Uncharacterized protein n=1 Tax=Lagenidium giganteum TaxID=4803 RepID=A0AAV2YN45_9STRA|nr:TPA: hypothetical protein N0F65_001053 [Lagenidium giganteum]